MDPVGGNLISNTYHARYPTRLDLQQARSQQLPMPQAFISRQRQITGTPHIPIRSPPLGIAGREVGPSTTHHARSKTMPTRRIRMHAHPCIRVNNRLCSPQPVSQRKTIAHASLPHYVFTIPHDQHVAWQSLASPRRVRPTASSVGVSRITIPSSWPLLVAHSCDFLDRHCSSNCLLGSTPLTKQIYTPLSISEIAICIPSWCFLCRDAPPSHSSSRLSSTSCSNSVSTVSASRIVTMLRRGCSSALGFPRTTSIGDRVIRTCCLPSRDIRLSRYTTFAPRCLHVHSPHTFSLRISAGTTSMSFFLFYLYSNPPCRRALQPQ
jgi:hypothetical protein